MIEGQNWIECDWMVIAEKRVPRNRHFFQVAKVWTPVISAQLKSEMEKVGLTGAVAIPPEDFSNRFY